MSGHHHSHHHKVDDATRFKRKSLSALRRRKLIAKWLFHTLIAIAIVLAIYVAYIYLF